MHLILCGVDILEILWRSQLTGVMQGVRNNIVVLNQLCLEIRIELLESRPGVGELGIPACTRWRKLVRFQQRVRCASWIEG